MEMTRELVEEFIKKCATFVGRDYDVEYHCCTNELYEMGYRNPEFIENPINWSSYHSDWNSIMEVVEKIEELKYTTDGSKIVDEFRIESFQVVVRAWITPHHKMYNIIPCEPSTKKKAVVQSINQFIDWYNNQKQL